MADRPLADSQKQILLILLETHGEGMTCNAIAMTMGHESGSDRSAHDGRIMGPANRIIPAITSLRKRGLTRTTYSVRRDNYPEVLTYNGARVAERVRRESP